MFQEMGKPSVRVDWMRKFANSPRIILAGIKVPEYPEATNPIWERTTDGLHLARVGDFAFYFYTDGRPTDGFGGRTFVGTLKDGTKFAYRGAWSSRAGCINNAIHKKELSGPYIVDIACDMYATAVSHPFLAALFYEQMMHKGINLWRNKDKRELVYEPVYMGKYKGDDGFEYPPEE